MQTRSGRVARYENALSTLPSEIVLSGDGDIPVTFIFEDDAPAFARGGLVRTADKIKRAGRYGDTEIIHVNKDELEELKQLWGEPTINPETGCPEYFLKKFFKKIIKPLAKIAPIAAMFIPGIGPLAAAAIGAVSGGITGGVKGAVLGGVTGGLGAAGASGAPSILGKTISSVAPSLSPVAARAASGAILGGLGSAAQGGNILKGALTGGALNAAVGPGGLINRGPTTITGAPAPPGSMPPGTMSYGEGTFNRDFIPAPQAAANPISVAPMDTSQLRVDIPQIQQSWLNRPFLGISDKIPNKFGVPVAGALALSALSGKKKTPNNVNANMSVQEIADKRFQPTFRAKLPDVTGMYADLAARPVNYGTIDEQYRYSQRPERSYYDYVPQTYAKGGKVRREMTDAERRIRKSGSNVGMPREMAEIGYPAEREGRRLKDTMPDLATSKAARLKKQAGGDVKSPFAVRGKVNAEGGDRLGALPDYQVAEARRPRGRVNGNERYISYNGDIPIGRGSLSVRAGGRGLLPKEIQLGAEYPVGKATIHAEDMLGAPAFGVRLPIGDATLEAATGGRRRQGFADKARLNMRVPFDDGGYAVRGKGTGRSDEIEALLSDGEYVMDAETVALLGDGSNEAGAKRLDEMRVSLRKHKGKNLAKGKFSVNAKRPEAYMAGGRV